MTPAQTLRAAALLAALATALGAFGTHSLRGHLSAELLSAYDTGVRYQMYAALALLALGTQPTQRRAPPVLLAGAAVFSLSLYALALSGLKILGAVTPIGGALMIAGFVLAALDVTPRSSPSRAGG